MSTTTATPWAEHRRLLVERRAELLATGPVSVDEDLDAPTGTLGETEHLAAYEQRQLAATLGAMQRQELTAVERALARIDDGTYGTCAECGVDISLERLEALPTATTCVRCPQPTH